MVAGLNCEPIPHAGLFFLVQTAHGEVLGAFCDRPATPMHVSEYIEYCGSKGCKPPRYRWDLGCILLKMPAISLRTGFLFRFGAPGSDEVVKAYRWSGLNNVRPLHSLCARPRSAMLTLVAVVRRCTGG